MRIIESVPFLVAVKSRLEEFHKEILAVLDDVCFMPGAIRSAIGTGAIAPAPRSVGPESRARTATSTVERTRPPRFDRLVTQA